VNTAVGTLDADAARAILIIGCATAGLDPSDAELMRLGSNAMFRLRSAPVIVRIVRDAGHSEAARREVMVARWLASEGVPAVRVLNVEQPLTIAGRVVTLWHSIAERVEYGTTAELAHLLRQLHSQTTPAALELPTVDALARVGERIESARMLTDDDRAFLRARHAELSRTYHSLSFPLPSGVIHGDANVGNVFRTRDGEAVLGDLESFAVGPREWDLVQTAMFYERFGWHTGAEYRAFVDGYGFDVMGWPGYAVLADLRELLMTTWLAQNDGTDATTAAELAKRLNALRTGGSRRDWSPF
jgi:aminoglycoside phosphotransferase (APT) family kinase protein